MAIAEDQILEQDSSLVKYIESLYEAGKRAKQPVEEKVKRFEKLWSGEHWNVERVAGPRSRTRAVSNFIFAIVETQVTWLTENRPNMIVAPMSANDTANAKILERIIRDYLWPQLNIRVKLKKVIRSGLMRGKGFLKVTWDMMTNQEHGGEVAVDYIPWWEIVIDPQANNVDDARYIIHARVMPLSEIVRRWPHKGWLVNPDPRYSDLPDEGIYSADIDQPVIASSVGDLRRDDRARAMVIECWIRDDTVELRKEFDEDSEEEVERVVPLYPNGRLVIVANGVVLTDVGNPYRDGKFPFVDFSCYETDDSPWDMGEVEQLEPIQRVMNILESRFVDNARLMTNTVWVKSADAGISSDKITNEEGAVYTIKNPRARFERVPPQPLPQHYFELYLQLQRNMETITGIHDVTQGRRPVGITAATAISLLQEAGQARIRDKARNLEDTIRKMGELIISRILQFYTPNRVIRLRGEDGQTQFVNFDPTMVDVGFDFIVEAGSSLQMNEQQRFQMAIELFRVGAIDIAGLLEATNFPGRDDIIQRMRAGQALLPSVQGNGMPGAGIASGSVPPLPPPPGGMGPT